MSMPSASARRPALPLWSRVARVLRHTWRDHHHVHRQIDNAALDRLTAQVQASEAGHSGEIRLCIEAGLPAAQAWAGVSARERAVELFSLLRVWDTEHNNGVLIYLLMAERRIEVVADRGIHARVGSRAWDEVVRDLAQSLQAGQAEAGLARAVERVGAVLQQHFGVAAGTANPNELPDRPVIR